MSPLITAVLLIIAFTTANRSFPQFGRIAGNKSATKCISGGLQSKSDLDITTTKMIQKEGYPAEEHVVLTDDGYYLTMHRIPGKRNAPPVLVQHGSLCSSFDWVVTGKGKGLAFILAENGYDVWLGNFRGSTFSQCHTNYDTSQVEFWNFTFHEMGTYDLPAEITYITKLTNQQVIYVGHSLGTTASYIMAIERPDLISKVKVLLSLSPIAYFKHSQSILHTLMIFLIRENLLTTIFGKTEILPRPFFVNQIIRLVCYGSPNQRKLCVDILFLILGIYDSPDDNYYRISPTILSHYPAGASTKAVEHFYQLRTSDRFQNYDYGTEGNLKEYGNSTPPEYDISKITIPVALFWSEKDSFAHPADVKRLSVKIANKILDYKIKLPQFSHLDFIHSTRALKYVYEKLLITMEKFRWLDIAPSSISCTTL